MMPVFPRRVSQRGGAGAALRQARQRVAWARAAGEESPSRPDARKLGACTSAARPPRRLHVTPAIICRFASTVSSVSSGFPHSSNGGASRRRHKERNVNEAPW